MSEHERDSNDREKGIEELLLIAGHELKNPLAAFSLQTYLLRQTLSSLEPGHMDHLHQIATNTDNLVVRMEKLLNRMITIVETQLK